MDWLYLLFGLAYLANSFSIALFSTHLIHNSDSSSILLVVIFLLLTLSTALIYSVLDFYFLGLASIIVYCGAIAIIFLFVIMMVQLSVGSSSVGMSRENEVLLASRMFTRRALNAANGSIISTGIFLLVFVLWYGYYDTADTTGTFNYSFSISNVYVYVYPVVTSLIFTSTLDIFNLGSLIYVAYPISLLLIAVSLWIVMVGIIQLLTIYVMKLL